MKKNILVFPCGSEIGLEIHRSLKYSTHFNLIGASSVSDHGEFVYEKYVDNVPYIDNKNIFKALNKIVEDYSIDAIYPTMDSVINTLAINKDKINCKIICSNPRTTEICLHKKITYDIFKNLISIPKIYQDIHEVIDFPIFIKPSVGYGSRGAAKIYDIASGVQHLKKYPDSIIMEYLPNDEYTIDCFTNKDGELLFVGPRQRKRVMNGISVNTIPIRDIDNKFHEIAKVINNKLDFRGAWFFQVKKNENMKLTLLEIACRLGGSSALYRNSGVNFAMLTLFDAFDFEVQIFTNNYPIVLDRALNNKYRIGINFSTAYIDFDDCLVINNSEVNTALIHLLYQLHNEKKRIILITKHEHDIHQSLSRFRLNNIFDEVIHLNKDQHKYLYIKDLNSIFIDDSFDERFQVHKHLNIPVFAPDNIESLLK